MRVTYITETCVNAACCEQQAAACHLESNMIIRRQDDEKQIKRGNAWACGACMLPRLPLMAPTTTARPRLGAETLKTPLVPEKGHRSPLIDSILMSNLTFASRHRNLPLFKSTTSRGSHQVYEILLLPSALVGNCGCDILLQASDVRTHGGVVSLGSLGKFPSGCNGVIVASGQVQAPSAAQLIETLQSTEPRMHHGMGLIEIERIRYGS